MMINLVYYFMHKIQWPKTYIHHICNRCFCSPGTDLFQRTLSKKCKNLQFSMYSIPFHFWHYSKSHIKLIYGQCVTKDSMVCQQVRMILSQKFNFMKCTPCRSFKYKWIRWDSKQCFFFQMLMCLFVCLFGLCLVGLCWWWLFLFWGMGMGIFVVFSIVCFVDHEGSTICTSLMQIHWNWVPTFIMRWNSIRYGFKCENRQDFRIAHIHKIHLCMLLPDEHFSDFAEHIILRY